MTWIFKNKYSALCPSSLVLKLSLSEFWSWPDCEEENKYPLMESKSSVEAIIDGSWAGPITFKINAVTPDVWDFFPHMLVFQVAAESKVLIILLLIFLDCGKIFKTISNQDIYKHIIVSPKVEFKKYVLFPLFPNKWTVITVLVNSNIKNPEQHTEGSFQYHNHRKILSLFWEMERLCWILCVCVCVYFII